MANEEKKGFFSPAQKGADLTPVMNEVNNLSMRVRISEERYLNLRKKLQVDEQNLLMETKKFSTEIKTIHSDINDIHMEINDLKEKFELLVKEIQLCAKKEDVDVLNKYLDLWEPVKFVTAKDVEKIARKILEEKDLNSIQS